MLPPPPRLHGKNSTATPSCPILYRCSILLLLLLMISSISVYCISENQLEMAEQATVTSSCYIPDNSSDAMDAAVIQHQQTLHRKVVASHGVIWAAFLALLFSQFSPQSVYVDKDSFCFWNMWRLILFVFFSRRRKIWMWNFRLRRLSIDLFFPLLCPMKRVTSVISCLHFPWNRKKTVCRIDRPPVTKVFHGVICHWISICFRCIGCGKLSCVGFCLLGVLLYWWYFFWIVVLSYSVLLLVVLIGVVFWFRRETN